MVSRKSWMPSAAGACTFNLWIVNQSSLQIAQFCGDVFDILVAVLSFIGFYTLSMNVFALYFWHKGKSLSNSYQLPFLFNITRKRRGAWKAESPVGR
ncbi:Uncharacterised protein [Serratia quinivorans]|nr:Uncharacterised protein [Serratia quinivorans]CAI2146697.1 Uncharacterised protein [Serratia quinivorans]